ncbi:MAG: hypothetical protein Kow0059_13920 [Candidatus Sumerlaeia bacterium]
MTTNLLQSLIEDVNRELDGVQAYRAIGYLPDRMRTVGDSLLKAFCPVHHPSDPSEKIPTLTINLQTRTFKCIKKGCEASAGGTLIELFALARGIPPLAAAVELARQTGIALDEDQLAMAARFALDDAQNKLEMGRPQEALKVCEFALSLSPQQTSALKLKSAICEALGQREEAIQAAHAAVDQHLAENQSEQALETLESLILQKDPHNEAALLQAAQLHETLGHTAQAVEYFVRVADDREEMNREDENLDLLRHLTQLAPERLDLRARLAGLYESLGDQDSAAAELLVLAGEFEKTGALDRAVEALRKLTALQPENAGLKCRLAAVLHRSGDDLQALDCWLSAADDYQARGEMDDALRCADEALAINPDSLTAARRKGELLLSAGQADGAREHYLALFERLESRGELDDALAMLRQARDCAPDDPEMQRRVIAFLAQQRRLEEAIEEMFRLTALFQQSDEVLEALSTLRQISQLQPKNKTVRLRVAQTLVQMGSEDKAIEEYKDLAQVLLEADDPDGALDVCTHARAVDAANPDVKCLQAQALEAGGQTAAALALYREAFESFNTAGRSQEAEEAICRALDLDPERPELLRALADFYLNAGRTQDAVIALDKMLSLFEAAGATDEITTTARQILELAPDRSPVRRRLAEALQAAGRTSEAIREYHVLARNLREAGQTAEAIAVCRTILDLDGDDLDALQLIAALLLETEGPGTARPFFDRQMEVLKILEDEEGVQALYETMTGLYPDDHALKHEWAVYLIGIGQEKTGITRLLELADEFRQAGELHEVARIYESLTELRPDEHEYVAALEETYRELGDTEGAAALCRREADKAGDDLKQRIFWLERLVDLDPGNPDHCRQLAEAFETGGQKNKALETYRRLVALNEETGHQADNVAVLEKLLALGGEDVGLRLKLAQVHEQQGRTEEACRHYLAGAGNLVEASEFERARKLAEKVVSLEPQNVNAWHILVKCHSAGKHTEELKRAWLQLAAIHIGRDELDEAIACHRQLRDLDPKDIDAGEALAALLERAGRSDPALEEYQRLVELLKEAGDHDRAIRLLRRMKDLRPADLDVRREIIILLDKEGRLAEAGDEALALARAQFEQKRERDAVSVVRRAIMFFDDHYDRHFAAFDLLMEFDRETDAFALLLSSAQRAFDNGDAGQALLFVERGLEIDETNRPLREFKVRAEQEMGDTESAAADLLVLARQTLAQEQFKEAELYLNECIGISPEDLEAHQLLAGVLEQQGRSAEADQIQRRIVDLAEAAGNRPLAIQFILKILDSVPGDTALRARLAELYLQDDQQAPAIEQFMILAQILLDEGRPGEARRMYQRVLSFDSSNLDCRIRLADLEWTAGRKDEARTQYQNILTLLDRQGRIADMAAQYRQLIERDPEFLQWRGDFAAFLAGNDQPDEAAAQLEDLIRLLEKRGRLDDALERLAELEQLRPEDASIAERMGRLNERLDNQPEAFAHYCRAAQLFRAKGDVEGTLRAYTDALSLQPGDQSVLTAMAQLLESENRLDEAVDRYMQLAAQYAKLRDAAREIETYEKILTLKPDHIPVLEILARLLESQRNLKRAGEVYLDLAGRLEQEGQIEGAIEIYRHLKTINPDALEPPQRLIALFKAHNRLAEARRELHDLAQVYHQQGGLTEAENCYLEMKALDPGDTTTLELMARFYETTGDLEKACQTYFELSERLQQAGQTDKAIGVLLRIRVLNEEEIQVAARLFSLYAAGKRWDALWAETERLLDYYFTHNQLDQVEEWGRRLRQARPDDVALLLKLADAYQSFNLFEQALNLIQEGAALESSRKRYREAIAICTRGLGIDSRHIPLRETMAEVYLKLDARREAVAQFQEIAEIARESDDAECEENALRRILKLDDSNAPALERLSELLIEQGRTDEAVEMLTTLSTIHQMANDIEAAIRTLLEVLRLQPGNMPIRESLAELYLLDNQTDKAAGEYHTLARLAREGNDPARARRFLEKIIEFDEENIEAHRQLLDVVDPDADRERYVACGLKLATLFRNIPAAADAIAVLQRVLSRDPDNFAVMEPLAELLVETEQNEQAAQLHRRMAHLSLEGGNDKKARRHFELMLSLHAADADSLHQLGRIYERHQELDLAAEMLERAVDLYRAGGDLTTAVMVCQELIAIRADDPLVYETYAQLLIDLNDQAGAANQLAMAAELHEQRQRYAEAIAALERLFSLDEHRLEERLKYAGLLERVGRVADAVEQFQLASRLYEDNGQIPAALNAALLAVKADGNNPASRRRVFDLFRQLGEIAEALEHARWLAAHYLEHEALEEAREIITLGLDLDDEDLTLHIRRAYLLKREGSSDEASQEFIRSAELAMIARKNDQAIECLQEAKALLPNSALVRRHLAGIYIDQGHSDLYRSEMIEAVNLLLNQGLIEEATQLTKEMKAKLGATPELRLALAENFESRGDPIMAAAEYAELASQLFQAGQPTRAQDIIERAIRLQPDNVLALETKLNILTSQNRNYEAFPVLQTLAELYQRQERWQEAEGALLQLRGIGPNDPAPLLMLVDFYTLRDMPDKLRDCLHELGQLYLDNDQIQDAVNAFGRIKELFPDDIKALSMYTDLYAQIGSEHEILSDYVRLAELYNKTGAVMEATKIYERVLLLDPASMDLREKFIGFLLANGQKTRAISEMFEFSRQCLEANQFREAQRVLKQAANLEPNDPQVYLQLAEADARANSRGSAILHLQKAIALLRESGDEDAVLDAYQRLISLDKGDIDSRRERYQLLVERSRTDEAIAAALDLADVYIRREFYDLAEELYLQILEWDPNSYKTWNDLVHIREILGHHEELLGDYRRWAEICAEAGDVDKALQCYKKIMELDPDNVEAVQRYIDLYMAQGLETELVEMYLRLADIHTRRGEFEAAANIYQHVMELDPDNTRAQDGLTSTRERRQKDLEVMGVTRPDAEQAVWDEGAGESRHRRRSRRSASDETTGVTPEPDALDAVIANYRNMLEMNPDNVQVRLKLAEVLEKRGDVDGAVTEYLAVSAILQNGDPERARDLCEKVLRLRPGNKIARDRLDKVIKKTDLFKALESAIDLSRATDHRGSRPPSSRSGGDSRSTSPAPPPAHDGKEDADMDSDLDL